jgi:hypothetical protein
MTAGRLLYLAYHAPHERLEALFDRALASRRDRTMRAAAARLAPLRLPVATHLPALRFLTGERFAHQTAFCAYSFCQAADLLPPFEFFDDGSLAPAQAQLLLRLFPSSSVISSGESAAALERELPAARFPALRHARACSPLMRKLVDLHVGRRTPTLYLDSDMLFFRRPDRLVAWLRQPAGTLHMTEPGPGAYVDSPVVLRARLGRELPSGVNTGIVALDGARLDWSTLESAASALGAERCAHKWTEQTLFAWLLAGLGSQTLDPADYRVCASRADLTPPTPVLRHYVHKAKMPYIAGEWRGCASFA